MLLNQVGKSLATILMCIPQFLYRFSCPFLQNFITSIAQEKAQLCDQVNTFVEPNLAGSFVSL